MEKTERFLLEMHMHTKETSSCGEVPAAEGVRLYKEAGYQGVMITDHYHRQYFDSLGDMDMSRKIDAYLTGCRAAKAEGDRIGLSVLLGIEFRNVESENDFLIVGMTEEFLYKYPETYLMSIGDAIDLFHAHGMLVIQAHPVRVRIMDWKDGKRFNSYPNVEMLKMMKKDPPMPVLPATTWYKYRDAGREEQLPHPYVMRVCELTECENKLDGIEVYNGNFHWAQEPEKIEGILRRHPEYIQISASDFHEAGHLASGGVVLDRPVKTSAELKDALLDKGIVELIRR